MGKTTMRKILTQVTLLILAVAFAAVLPACGRKAGIPSKEAFLKSYQGEPDPHGMKEDRYDLGELLKAWGTPDVGGGEGPSMAWECGGKYIIAWVDPDRPGTVIQMFVSMTQDMVYLFSNGSTAYVCLRNGDTTDYGYVVMFPEEWLDREIRDNLEEGTILQMEFDGMFMESYPAQINRPFAFKILGRIPEAEIPELEAQAQSIRDFVTGKP